MQDSRKNGLTRYHIDGLFCRMLMSYGQRFERMWGGAGMEKVVEFWHDELQDLTEEEFIRGSGAIAGLDYPPTLPQFRKLCRPEMDFTAAYYEAVNGLEQRRAGKTGEWSHPAVYWAAVSMAYDLLGSSYSAIKQRFEKALKNELEKGRWDPIPAACPAIGIGGGKTEEGRRAAEKVLARYGAKESIKQPTPNVREGHSWICRNLQRMADGKRLFPYTKRITLEAAAAVGIDIPEQLRQR